MIAAPTFRKIATLLQSSGKSIDSLAELPVRVCVCVHALIATPIRPPTSFSRVSWSNFMCFQIEIPLPKRFRRHSVFSCPVSREQPSETNPPVLLKCGHAILRSSMDSIVKRANRCASGHSSRGLLLSPPLTRVRSGFCVPRCRFKCPTCYAEMTPSDVMPLHI